ncbi:MAG: DUF892 family protein [Opitutales bacterium]|nr:DUF892 family protein [Opitutales bacterium]
MRNDIPKNAILGSSCCAKKRSSQFFPRFNPLIIDNEKSSTLASLTSLHARIVEELKDLYHAENQLLKALPKMAKAATNSDLKAGFNEHLDQTRGHVERLAKSLKILGVPARGKPCPAMQGLAKSGSKRISRPSEMGPRGRHGKQRMPQRMRLPSFRSSPFSPLFLGLPPPPGAGTSGPSAPRLAKWTMIMTAQTPPARVAAKPVCPEPAHRKQDHRQLSPRTIGRPERQEPGAFRAHSMAPPDALP